MSKYRILERTYKNGNTIFFIQRKTSDWFSFWLSIESFYTLEEARSYINELNGFDIATERVVE